MSILNSIIANKKSELKTYSSNWNIFANTFKSKSANVIWEIKLASPSFDYSKKIDLEKIIKFYWTNGQIKWISILIDEKFFKWDINRIQLIKKFKKPILFKEFVIDEKQIDWAFYHWYDWLLLIKRILSDKKLKELLEYTLEKWIFPIVEVDNEKDLKSVLKFSNSHSGLTRIKSPLSRHSERNEESIPYSFWIALNSRNLSTMTINKNFHFEMYEKYKKEFNKKIVFAFSGIKDLNEAKKYEWKFNGVLIGKGLVEKFI